MIDFDDVIKQNIIEHNPNWPEIQNNNTWRLCIWKKKFIMLSNNSLARY